MPIHVTKPRLPAFLGYPLKTTMLESSLRDADISVDVQLVYWTPQSGGSVLEGHYWLPNENVPHDRVYVRAGSVPTEVRHVAAEALTQEGLPSFVAWLRKIIALPPNSPARNQRLYFNAVHVGRGLLQVASTPQLKTVGG